MAIGRPIELTPNITSKNISIAATEGQTEFTVTGGYRINEIGVYRNGVRLVDGRDFSATDGQTVTFISDTVVADDIVEFSILDSFDIAGTIVSAASTQTLNGNLHVTESLFAGTFNPTNLVSTAATFNSTFHVGSALTANAAGDVESIGIITAASFSGDGSALTGLANTDFVVSVATTTGDLKVGAAVTVGGIVNIDATTDSTSTSTGALIVDGGLGVAKNVYIGAGLSVAGTLTYEDVTNVDSVGMVTAKSGVNVSGGQLQVGVAYSVGAAGVCTAAGLSIDSDSNKIFLGADKEMQVFHNGTDSLIKDTRNSGTVKIQADNFAVIDKDASETMLSAAVDGAVTLRYNGNQKFVTTNDGTVTTGIATATVGIDAAISVWTLGASGTDHYTFTGPGNLSATSDPTLNLIRGQKYTFKNRSGGHPFRIQSTPNGSAGTAYNTGVTNNDGGDGTNIIFDVPYDAPAVLYYQCTAHNNMGGVMYISGSGYETKIGTGITFGTAGVTTFSGTADVHLHDNVRLNVGDASDLAIYHDGSHSYVRSDSVALRIRSNDLRLQSATGEEYFYGVADGGAHLYHDNSLKLQTTGDGITVTGAVTADSAIISGHTAIGSGVTIGSAGVSTFSGTADVHLLDNVKLNIGDGPDLQLSHSGTNSVIDNNTGGLYIRNNVGGDVGGDIYIQAKSGENSAIFTHDGSAALHYDNAKKFETTNDGTVTTGVCTATSFSGSGANLTGIDASPTVSGICTGSVAAHKPIMVNSSGQFKTPTGQSESTGSEQLFESSDGAGRVQFLYMADLDKYALIYTDPDDNNKIWARVGTRSGTSFSYGTVTEIYNNGSDCLSADYMGGGKIIMCANPNGRVSLLSVSGTSISEESGATTTTTYVSTFVVRAVSSTKAILVYRRTYDGKIYAVVITRSGTSISLGSAAEIYNNVGTENQLEAVWNPTRSKLFVIWKHGSNDGWYAKSLTYSGTSIVENTDTVALTGGNASTNKTYPKVAYDPVSTNIILTLTGAASGTSRIFVVTQSAGTSGTDLAFGSAQGDTGVAWAENDNTVDSGCYGMSCDGQGNIFIAFKNADDSYQTYGCHLTISGTTVTLVSGPTEINSTSGTSGGYFGATVARFSVDESPEDIVFPFTFTKPTGGSQKAGVAVKLLDGTDLTTENFIGFSDASGGSSGDTITVKVVGNTTTQSSLTAGQVYYVQNDGTLSTTAADPSVVAGRAISSTSLLIQPV